MQILTFLIIASLSDPALANEGFNRQLSYHAAAVAATREAIAAVSSTQVKFSDAVKKCGPGKVKTQAEMLKCSHEFSLIQFELNSQRFAMVRAEKAVASISPSFIESQKSLQGGLAASANLLNQSIAGAVEASKSFQQANTKLVRHLFAESFRKGFTSKKIESYCEKFERRSIHEIKLAEHALVSQYPVPDLYLHVVRLEKYNQVAKKLKPICGKEISSANSEQTLLRLKPLVTTANFTAYKKSVCGTPRAKLNSREECLNLPLTPFSAEFLSLPRGRQ